MATPKVASSPKSAKRVGSSLIDSKSVRDSASPPAGAGKANFNDIYNCPDPRALFATLQPLSYQIPQQAMPLFNRVLDLAVRDRDDGKPPKVLDVCCSYGINAALLRYRIDLEGLYDHFISKDTTPTQIAATDSVQQLGSDKTFFADRLARPDLTVVGLDTAANAIHYASSLNIHGDGWAENLETNAPSLALQQGLRDVGVIFCTGGIGYVGPATFRRILTAVDSLEQLWIVAVVLRIFSYDKIASVYDSYGLVTEKLEGVLLRQRRFTSDKEQNAAIADVVARGLDPEGLEAEGWFYAECYVTRPAAVAERMKLGEALEGLYVPE